jgi:hypothetical protein
LTTQRWETTGIQSFILFTLEDLRPDQEPVLFAPNELESKLSDQRSDALESLESYSFELDQNE